MVSHVEGEEGTWLSIADGSGAIITGFVPRGEDGLRAVSLFWRGLLNRLGAEHLISKIGTVRCSIVRYRLVVGRAAAT